MSAIDRLASVLERSGLLTVLQKEGSAGSATLLCRLSEGAEEALTEQGGLIHLLLREEKDWSSHICHRYLLRGESKEKSRLAVAWNFSFSAADEEALEAVSVEIEEIVQQFLAHRARIKKKGPELDEIGVFGDPARNTPTGADRKAGAVFGGAAPLTATGIGRKGRG